MSPTYSIFRYGRERRRGVFGCLINKTVAPSLSVFFFCGLPPGIYTSRLSALMGRRYLDFDGCIFSRLPCARPLQVSASLAEQFCSERRPCQTCQSKSLIFLAHRTTRACSIVRGCWNVASSFLLFKKEVKKVSV